MKAKIVNEKGLHARASAKLAELCEGFEAQVEIAYDGVRADGRSIMGLMMLGAAQGAELEIRAEGDDADDARLAIAALLADRFGEKC